MTSPEKNLSFEQLLTYIRENRSFDFSGYKQSSLMRRFNTRMQYLNLENLDFAAYIDYLEVHPEEFNCLFNTILINVTEFFRDTSAWEYLCKHIIPHIVQRKDRNDQIRIWCAGCASGEEAYTLAILMAEALGVERFRQKVKIYATDIDEEALKQARRAMYTIKDIENIAIDLRDKYFELVGNNYIFRSDFRRSVIFGRHDLLQDAPISRLDLLVCRNALMYFNSEAQARIIAKFHFAINHTGYLFLGKAEMLLMYPNLFFAVNLKHRVFSKNLSYKNRNKFLLLDDSVKNTPDKLYYQIQLRELAFDVGKVAEIVIDMNGLLVMINSAARNLFNLSNQDLNRPFYELEISYRPLELRSLIETVYKERRKITLTHVERYISETQKQYLDVHIIPLQNNDLTLLGVSIYFEDVTRYVELEVALHNSQQALETTNEELQSTNEELETTNEELQSTNEELETTNEELQSTNQELETMNEELQSANEELQTINYELSERTLELNQTNIFITYILKNLQIGLIVIDHNFSILIWNHLAEDLWGLRQEEVINKSLFSLDIGLSVDNLRSPILDIISEKENFKEIIIEATNRCGKLIQCYISISPMMENKIDSIVLAMADVDQIKAMISTTEN